MRHGEAALPSIQVGDFDRPLTTAGVQHLTQLKKSLSKELGPDLILCSSSLRTQQTLQCLEGWVNPTASLTLCEQIYRTDAAGLLKLIEEQDDKFSRLLLIGHNPSLGDFLEGLLEDHTQTFLGIIPPAGLIKLNFHTDSWALIHQEKGELTTCSFR